MKAPVEHVLEHFGAILISGVLAVIGWVMKTFTTQHIESMKDLTREVRGLSADVAEMKGDIRVLKDQSLRADERLDRLEDRL